MGEEKKICYPQTSNTLESEMKEKKATVDSEPCAKTADAKVVKKIDPIRDDSGIYM